MSTEPIHLRFSNAFVLFFLSDKKEKNNTKGSI